MSDSPENFPDYAHLTDRQRWRLAALEVLNHDLNDAQAALDKLQHDDPVGAVFFADDDAWLDSRLSGGRAK